MGKMYFLNVFYSSVETLTFNIVKVNEGMSESKYELSDTPSLKNLHTFLHLIAAFTFLNSAMKPPKRITLTKTPKRLR